MEHRNMFVLMIWLRKEHLFAVTVITVRVVND